MKWRDIRETNNMYEVSSCGNIRRKEGVVDFGSQKRKVGGKILSPKTKSNGYLEVSLNFLGGKGGKSFYVHRLVASNWIGDIPKGMCINHKDADKSNNSVENLEIVTYSENSNHAVRMGLRNDKGMQGSAHPMATVDEDTVREIRRLYDSGVESKIVARMFDMNLSTARKIMYRTTWKHI